VERINPKLPVAPQPCASALAESPQQAAVFGNRDAITCKAISWVGGVPPPCEVLDQVDFGIEQADRGVPGILCPLCSLDINRRRQNWTQAQRGERHGRASKEVGFRRGFEAVLPPLLE
jgi:hypothetical protein